MSKDKEVLPAFTMEKFTGSVEVHGWWTPEPKEGPLKGILVGFISEEKSSKLKSDLMVFELLEDLAKCKDAEDTTKIVTLKKGKNVAVSIYTDLVGLYPAKLGHVCYIKQIGTKVIPGQDSPMKLFDKETSTAPVRNIAKPEGFKNGSARVPFEV